MNVDFPAPFSPTSACISPSLPSRVTSFSALTPGNVLVICLISNNVFAIGTLLQNYTCKLYQERQSLSDSAFPFYRIRLFQLICFVISRFHEQCIVVVNCCENRVAEV